MCRLKTILEYLKLSLLFSLVLAIPTVFLLVLTQTANTLLAFIVLALETAPILHVLRQREKRKPLGEGRTFDDKEFADVASQLEAYRHGEIERDKALSKRR